MRRENADADQKFFASGPYEHQKKTPRMPAVAFVTTMARCFAMPMEILYDVAMYRLSAAL